MEKTGEPESGISLRPEHARVQLCYASNRTERPRNRLASVGLCLSVLGLTAGVITPGFRTMITPTSDLVLILGPGVISLVASVCGAVAAKSARRDAVPGFWTGCLALVFGASVTVMVCGAAIQYMGESSELRARNAAIKCQVAISMAQTVRAEIERYKLQHGTRNPSLQELGSWTVMTRRTNDSGTVSSIGVLGPYLAAAPINPLTMSSQVVSPSAPSAAAGWVYDEATGQIRLIVPTKDAFRFTGNHPEIIIIP